MAIPVPTDRAPHAPERPLTCLVTGATGYIGGRLVPELLAAGHRVRVMARSPERLRDHPWAGSVEIVRADARDAEQVAAACAGADVVYYLIHALGGGASFEETDRRTAEVMARAAREADVGRLVYLGGLEPEGETLSAHLRSRGEVADILLASGVPTAVLRAAIVLGSGSASFEMLRYLTERLPVMVTPRWVHSQIQPIAVRDVLRYLVGCARLPASVHRSFDIGGPDVMNYAEMMQRYATVAGLPRRRILPVPFFTPSLSSHWVGVVTPVPASIARPLVESLRNTVVCREHDIAEYLPDPPEGLLGFDEAVRLAVQRVKDSAVATRWSSASVPGAPSDPLPTDPDWAGGSLYVDERVRETAAPPAALWRGGGGSDLRGGGGGAGAGGPARRAVAGGRGHRRGYRLVLLPPRVGGARAARPAGRRSRPAAGTAQPPPALRRGRAGLLAGGGGRGGAAAQVARGDAAARAGLAGVPRGTAGGRDAPAAEGDLPPAGAARPRVLVGDRAVPRDRLRRHGPRHRPDRRAGCLAEVPGHAGQRGEERTQQPGVVLDQQGAVPIGPDRRDVAGRGPEVVAVVGVEQEAAEAGVLQHPAQVGAVLLGQEQPAAVELRVAAGQVEQAAPAVPPEPGRGQPHARQRQQRGGGGDRVLQLLHPARPVGDVERDEVDGAGAAAQHVHRVRVLADPAHRGGRHQLLQDGVLGPGAVAVGPALARGPLLCGRPVPGVAVDVGVGRGGCAPPAPPEQPARGGRGR